MQALDDLTLLREYAVRGSEAAFETLVSRRIGFVYAAALRQTGDPHRAQEVTQAVFIILSKKPGSIRDGTVLSGWLFKTVRFAAMAQARAQTRRRQYEQEAFMQSEFQQEAPDQLWEQIAPLLDEGLAQLGEKDRQAVLLRFFENKTLAEVGGALGAGEDATRMRVNRTLEKLRRFFQKRGVVSTGELIGGAMSAHWFQNVPPGLDTTISAAVLKGSAVAAPIMTLVKGTLNIMAWIKTKTVIAFGVGTLLAGAAMLTIREQEEQNRAQEAKIRAQEQALREQEQQGNLTPEQHAVLEQKMNDLRAQQDVLRAKQDRLRLMDSNPFGRRSLQLSPFTHVRFDGDKVLVMYDGTEYGWVSVNHISAGDLMAFCRDKYKDLAQKRMAEDLLVALSEMGHPVDGKTVDLDLIDPKTGEKKNVGQAAMSEKNRQAVSAALRKEGIVK